MEQCPVEGCGKSFDSASDMRSKASLRSHIRFAHKEANPGVADDVNISSVRTRSDTVSETLEEKVTRLRKERVPIGVPEKKWSCPVNDGYHYRVFNDNWMTRPGNIQKAKAAGYEFVDSESDRQKPQIVGTNDNGTAITGYLMRIPQEIFDEDQKAKQKEVDRIDEQIKAGSLQQSAGDRRYIPSTGIKISADHRAPE